MKKILFILLMVLGIWLISETAAFLLFTAFQDRLPFYDIEQYLVPGEYIKYARQRFHPERGWDMNYATPEGERPRQTTYGIPLIAAFGDSFTHCDEVEDDQTWEEYTAAMLQADVYNFGTGGYGTDQAYLKFKEYYPERIKTAFVVLGLTTENINRLVNVYRPFYSLQTGVRVPKPRFKITADNRLELIPNPARTEDGLKKLSDPEFIRQLGEHDYWFNQNDLPVLKFPHTALLFNKRLWREVIYKKRGKISDLNPQPWADLWDEPEPTRIMFALLDKFAQDVRQNGGIPIVMIFPTIEEVDLRFRQGVNPLGARKIVEHCRTNNILVFNGIEAFAKSIKAPYEVVRFFDLHLNPDGNRLMALHFVQFLGKYLNR